VGPALLALIFGMGLILAAGFAWPSALHNATHDTRHALGLPCN
jgi:cobalt transporter subunit CbtB